MSLIAILVEGEDDQYSYESLFKKVRPDLNIKTFLLNGCNKKALKDNFPILREKINSQYSGYELGLIICDCDTKCAPERAKFMIDALGKAEIISGNIRIHATNKELETFFLSCIEDVKIIDDKHISFKKIKNLESITNHKEHLKNLLSRYNITYGKKTAEQISQQLDINKLEKKSKNFGRLKEIICNI